MLTRPTRQTAASLYTLPLLTIVVLAVSACAFQKDPKSKEKNKIAELEQQLDANRPLAKTDFTHVFIAGNAPNEYSVRMSWPSRPLQIKILKSSQLIKVFDARTENTFEGACVGGSFDYTVQVISPDTGIVGDFLISERCPTDLIVERDFADVEILERVHGRLFLGNGALIGLQNQNLNLDLQELVISGSATIRTYDASRESRLNEDINITSGPTIKIRAKKISGLLKLELNGVDGQLIREFPVEFDPSLDGKPGIDGQLGVRCNRPPSRIGDHAESCTEICIVAPTSGENGRDAALKKGTSGSNGVRGIGTSNVTIDVEDHKAMSLQIEFNPGIASRPGIGSLPMGGKPGAPGKNPGAPCVSPAAATHGKPGLRGDTGKPAANGACGVVQMPAELIKKLSTKDRVLDCSKVPGTLRPL